MVGVHDEVYRLALLLSMVCERSRRASSELSRSATHPANDVTAITALRSLISRIGVINDIRADFRAVRLARARRGSLTES